jgi:site-specific DNA recombinase
MVFRVFVGVAAYKGKHFVGEHEAILDRAVWEQVQAMLGRGDQEQRARQNRPSRAPALLKGLIFADDGWAMTPGATHKGDKVYRYYVNTAAMKIGKEACSVSRAPAGEVEAAVIAQVTQSAASTRSHVTGHPRSRWPLIPPPMSKRQF